MDKLWFNPSASIPPPGRRTFGHLRRQDISRPVPYLAPQTCSILAKRRPCLRDDGARTVRPGMRAHFPMRSVDEGSYIQKLQHSLGSAVF